MPKHSSDTEVPIPRSNDPPPASDKRNNGGVSPKPTSHSLSDCHIPRHRFLSHSEWTVFAHGVGAIRDAEHQAPVHPKSWWWPPKGLPQGLYRAVISQRTKAFYVFHMTSIARWTLMILQLLLGATLTALGSMSLERGTPITVLGAANTVIAGFLAFLHNSGLPDRYWYDMAEYEEVEDHIREILDAAMIPADHTLDQVLAECFDLYQSAKAIVLANKPPTYTTSQGIQAGRRFVPALPPPATTSTTTSAPAPGPAPTIKVSKAMNRGGGGSSNADAEK
ncbi:hypothetical protein B0T10DRAFT_587051 [Thelonectria olida]|uniref:SMODS and SLOG-associating 2TM effector domain-containing protein n=1 Tax=Thelonectria olida TaxID=1576542 RepID=A0A9P9AT73_9HYPO|nr:hypothetical protein B0T10DRAFT_587051 [Thelonectria olida]